MSYILLLGRLIFGGYFLYNGLKHLLNRAQLAAYAQSKGVGSPVATVISSGLLILLGGAMVVLGIYPRLGLVFIAVFLVGVTFKMHAFWRAADPQTRALEKVQFLKNMALLGATLMLLGLVVSWPLSLLFA
jgi:uncharacterized membrane protein YphA (DoxX/SURF4 family)